MATTPNSRIFPQAPNNSQVQFTDANGTVEVDLWTPGSNGGVCKLISACGNHTADKTLSIYYHDGTNSRLLFSVTVADLAGTNGGTDPAKNVLNGTDFPCLLLDSAGNRFVMLESGHKLRAVLNANCESGKTLQVFAAGEDY